jgi:hypothetical protein
MGDEGSPFNTPKLTILVSSTNLIFDGLEIADDEPVSIVCGTFGLQTLFRLSTTERDASSEPLLPGDFDTVLISPHLNLAEIGETFTVVKKMVD